MDIIRGTTPTITYTFKTVAVEDLSVAIMTIKHNGEVCVQKDLAAATVDENAISWTLTQEETLSVQGYAEIMLNWKTGDGVRGASEKKTVTFEKNHIEEVI